MSNEFKPFVSADKNLKEFTVRALLIGLFLAVLLGAANAYLGLKAGMTIAATYPAAVLGMALLRLFKDHNIIEENFTRTVGSIGESVAAGAIFTLPAFLIAGVWSPEFFGSFSGYLKSTVIMMVGGIVGILFVTLLRRVMVEDPELKFPESVAASEIHKAGRGGATGAKYLFYAMGIGGLIELLKGFNLLAAEVGKIQRLRLQDHPAHRHGREFQGRGDRRRLPVQDASLSPAFLGVGYIIGPRLAALNFAGGVLSWGLFVPLLTLLLAPQYAPAVNAGLLSWADVSTAIFQNIVKTVAIGGMLMSAAFTLFKMRKSLIGGIRRSVDDVKKAATSKQATLRTDKDINIKIVFCRSCWAWPWSPSSSTGGSWASTQANLVPGPGGGAGHAGRRLLFRRRLGLPGRPDRLLEQPDLGPDPLHPGDRRHPDGDPGRQGHPRRDGRPGRRRRHLRFGRRGRRDAPGPEGRPHPGRHSLENAGRRPDRRDRLLAGHVDPAVHPQRRRPENGRPEGL